MPSRERTISRLGIFCSIIVQVLNSLFKPAIAVKITITDGFSNMRRFDGFGTFKVSDGAGNTKDAVVGTNGKVELVHGCAKTAEGCIIEDDVLLKQGTRHLGIAMNTLMGFVTRLLNLPCLNYSLTNLSTTLPCRSSRHIFDGKRLHLHLQVYTVEDFIYQ